MQTITASDARQRFAEIIKTARQDPVFIQRQKRDIAVLMSMEEYKWLVHLNAAEFQRFIDQVGAKAHAADMTEGILQGLLREQD